MRITVVGDSMLDHDIVGTSNRDVPEGGGPVVDVTTDIQRPGGAALAALLLAKDGAEVRLVSAFGADEAAENVQDLLAASGVDVHAMKSKDQTREKVRIRTKDGTIARIDRGLVCRPEPTVHITPALRSADVVLVCDYGGGVLGSAQLRDALSHVSAPVVWDPHPRGSAPIAGSLLATPNKAEATYFCGDERRPVANAHELAHRWGLQAVAVTVGAEGAVLFDRTTGVHTFAAPNVSADDVCGAGDRFAASVAGGIARNTPVQDAVRSAVSEAAEFVAAGGASGIRLPANPGVNGHHRPRLVAAGGCFDVLHAGHVALLEEARQLGDRLVVLLNSDSSVRRLKGSGRPVVNAEDRRRLLLALGSVDDVVVFDEDTPEAALRRLRPDVFVKGGDYRIDDLPEASVIREWGGRVEVLPFLPGRSSSRILDAQIGRPDKPQGREHHNRTNESSESWR